MKLARKALAFGMSALLLLGSVTGCGTKGDAASVAPSSESGESVSGESKTGAVKEFSAFFAVPGTEINDDNEVQQKITEIIGAKCKETWLTGQTASEAIGTLIAGGEYPDFVDGSDGTKQLLEAGAYVALDDYLDQYPNLKNFFTDAEWEQIREAQGGHIYYVPQFGIVHGKETNTLHNDEAFWIQTRVLKWANYPKVETLDEYFDLIDRYLQANPAMKNGTKNIGYTILCDDWRYFCLENAPLFLDGYPNDGSVIVEPNEKKIIDYNTTPTAKRYFQKLNEEFKKGTVDPESFTQKYDQYISKLSTGRVLGMVDQWWDFANNVNASLKKQKLDEEGCDYVPLPVTIDKGIKNQWHTSGGTTLDVSNGVGISVSCKDVKGALQFLNDLLRQDVLTLRSWGVKDVDYKVGSDGLFSRTDEQRARADDATYKASHFCSYSYFPAYEGMNLDDINAATPNEQVDEFFASLNQDVKDCFSAYGVKTYVGMIGDNDKPGSWYPMWSYSNNLTTSTASGTAWAKMGECKHQWLPKVCMAKDFSSEWNSYMNAYKACKPEDFLNDMQKELDRRLEVVEKSSAS